MRCRTISFQGIAAVFALAATVLSCRMERLSDDGGQKDSGQVPGQQATVRFILPQLEGDASPFVTKTEWAEGKQALVWSSSDTIGIFPADEGQIYYPLTSSAGGNDAIFDGGGWKLKGDKEYMSYYPFVSDMLLSAHSIPYSVAGQVQTANGIRKHDGYDCLWARATTDDGGSVNFTYHRLCAFIKFVLTPGAGTYSELLIHSDAGEIPVAGSFDLTAANPAITDVVCARDLSMSLGDGITLAGADESITLYMAVIPCTFGSGQHVLSISLKDSEGKLFTYSKDFAGITFEANRLYNITSDDLQPDASLWFLLQRGTGIYDLENSEEICAYKAGADCCSHFSGLGQDIFKVMNPSADDAKYKFLSMQLSQDARTSAGAVSIYIYAPSNADYSGQHVGAIRVRSASDGTVWYRSNDGKTGFIVKYRR